MLLGRTPAGLIGLRALLGLSAALIAPVSMPLAFRLFTDGRLRMLAITIISTVGICGFALGLVVAGSVIATLPWQVLLVVNGFVRAESHAQLVVAVLVAALTVSGGRMLTDSRATEEH